MTQMYFNYSLLLTISRFTCPKIAVLFTGSFQAVLFYLLTQAVLFFFADSSRKKGSQRVKSFYFCIGQQKKKEPVKRTAILGHVNWLNLVFKFGAQRFNFHLSNN